MQCYFNLRHGPQFIADENGIVVNDLDQARFEATKVIRELLAEAGDDAERWKGWTMEMAGSDGKTIFKLLIESDIQ